MKQVDKLYILMLACIVISMSVFYSNVKTDDSFIYYSYVKNIVVGNGWVFNDGERINACTSVLYPLLTAIVAIPSNDNAIPIIGNAIGLICLFSFCIFMFLSFTGSVRYFVPILILANPIIFNGLGMETFLVFSTMGGSVYFYTRKKHVVSAFFVSLSILSRPDAFLFAAVFYSYTLVKDKRIPNPMEIIALIVPILPWILFAKYYFGDILPSTLSAKLCQARSGSFGSGMMFLSGFNDIPFYGGVIQRNAVWVLFIASSAVVLFKTKTTKLDPVSTIFILWGLVHTFVYGLILNTVNFPWYYTYVSIPMAIVISTSISFINNKSAKIAVLLTIITIAICSNYYIGKNNDRWWKYEIYKSIAERLKTFGNSKSIACSEIGVLKYYYGGPIVDAIGLVSKGQSGELKSGDQFYYLKKYRPHYLVLNYPPKNITENIDLNKFCYDEIGKISLNRRVLKVYELKNEGAVEQ